MANKIVNVTKELVDQIYNIEQSEILVPWYKKSIEDLIDNKDVCFRALVDDDIVVGYYSYAKIIDEAHINNIAVIKDKQSKGYGTALMQDLICVAKESGIIACTLEVESNNVKALGLYRKFGFVTEGIRKKYYKNTYDAIIMWRR